MSREEMRKLMETVIKSQPGPKNKREKAREDFRESVLKTMPAGLVDDGTIYNQKDEVAWRFRSYFKRNDPQDSERDAKIKQALKQVDANRGAFENDLANEMARRGYNVTMVKWRPAVAEEPWYSTKADQPCITIWLKMKRTKK